MLTFAPPYVLLDGVLTIEHQPSAFDTWGSLYETTRLHFPQASGHLTVRTHLQSRVHFSPVSLTKTRQWLCGLLSMAAAAVRTHQESRVESCRVVSSRVTRVLPSQDSWWRMFNFRLSDSSYRAWRLLSWGRNGWGKAYSPSERLRGNFRRFALWAPIPRLHSQRLAENCTGGRRRLVERFIFYFDDDDIHNNKNNTNISNNVFYCY